MPFVTCPKCCDENSAFILNELAVCRNNNYKYMCDVYEEVKWLIFLSPGCAKGGGRKKRKRKRGGEKKGRKKRRL